MPFYRIRIDESTSVTDVTLKAFLVDKSVAYLLVHHTTTTDNPHYHAYVETKYTQGNFSNLIKKTFAVKGSDYSNKTCSIDRKHEFFSYLFNTKKGNVPRYVSSEGIDNLTIHQAKENANQIAQEFNEKMKQAKKTKFDIAEFVAARDSWQVEDMYDDIVDALHGNRMCSAPYVVRDILATVIHLKGGQGRDRLREQTLKFFSG